MKVWLLEISSNDRDILSRLQVPSIWETWPSVEQVISHFEGLSKEPGDYGLLLDSLRETQKRGDWPRYSAGVTGVSTPIAPPANPLCKDSHWTARFRSMPIL